MKVLIKSTFLLVSLALVGCGEREYRVPQSVSVGTVVSSSAPMSETDTQFATNICEAFRFKKNHILLNSKIGTEYSHKLTQESCNGSPTTEVVESNLLEVAQIGGYLFSPKADPANPFFREMQTNTHGYLASFCEKILGGNEVKSRTLITASTEIVEINFSIDGFDIVRSKRNESGDYVAYEVESYEIKIDTADTTSTSKHGMVVKTTLSTKCDNDSVIKLSQELL